ncbi:MAG: hypothetical protein F4182_01345 [Gammaproteobacteria bacterium]|nr:hypothetical protein [Gammaproteobacteria bacterium]MYK38230.1 hypothetical protein [Gammaproteobacteria bacterium]
MDTKSLVLSGLVGAVIAALVGWIGNYLVQVRVQGLHFRVDRLRRALYAFLDLTTRYWLSSNSDVSARQHLEAQIIVAQEVYLTEYSVLAKRYRRIKKSHDDTKDMRDVLLDAATGGCFQQEQWRCDLERPRLLATAVTSIVKSLN